MEAVLEILLTLIEGLPLVVDSIELFWTQIISVVKGDQRVRLFVIPGVELVCCNLPDVGV